MVYDTQLLILFVLLLLSGFFSGSETALMSISRLKVKHLIAQKKKGAKILLKLKEHPTKLMITILIGNNLVNIAASAIAANIAITMFGSIGIGIATGVMTFLVLIIGEITPKNFAIVHSEKIALLVARPIYFLQVLIYPIVWTFDLFTDVLIESFGKKPNKKIFSEAEFKTMVEVGVEENELEKKEKELIESILEFNDINAREVMTDRTKMFCLNENLTVKKAIPLINKHGYSRVPIYRNDKDTITGILYVKDILKIRNPARLGKIKLSQIARRPFFINENMIIDKVFRTFQKQRVHIAIVRDEFGGTAGLVTMEDLIEEIFGEIIDESDVTPDQIVRHGKNKIVAHADTEIAKINDFFNVNLPVNKSINTIGKFFISKSGKNFKVGDVIEYKNLIITVKEMFNKKLLHLTIEKNSRNH